MKFTTITVGSDGKVKTHEHRYGSYHDRTLVTFMAEKFNNDERDRGERKQVEESLQQANEWTETILQSIQSGVFVIDVETHKILDINHSAQKMIGAPRAEIVGKICHAFVCPDARGNCPITDKGLKLHNKETVLIRKDGSRVAILKTANQVTLNGRACLIESFVDISAIKLAEEAARAHQERFKIFFSSVNDAIFVHPLREEGFAPFIEVNNIACQRYGYTRAELLKLTAADITKQSDADKHASSEHRKKLLAQRHLFFETVHIKKSGKTFPVEINSNIVEQYGKPVILAVVRDISERKQAEEEKNRIEARFLQSQKVEAIGRLAGGVAHDLNNLLTPIIGYGELLADDMNAEPLRMEFVQQIVQAGYRARDLVKQLLAFGRKQTMKCQSVNLNHTIERFANLLRRTIREDIELTFIPSNDLHPIRADIGQIEQVIMNLCVNAQDAMPEGGKLTLATTMVNLVQESTEVKTDMAAGTFVVLSVSDTGCGMDKETQGYIFEPFFTTKGKQGTGLGLSTVYGIVKQHGCHIRVNSTPGRGSTFEIFFPVSTEAYNENKSHEKSPIDSPVNETILLVEDDQQVRLLSATILKRHGYRVLMAANGREALEVLESHNGPLQLLLTDLVMPGTNGKDLYNKAAGKVSGLKVLYMSGYTDDVIAHHGVLEQGVHFIQKPFSIQALAVKVREVLDAGD